MYINRGIPNVEIKYLLYYFKSKNTMKTKILLASIFTAALFLTVSCGEDKPNIPAAETFALITGDATDITVDGATLNGSYNADQAKYVSKIGFAYRASSGTTWAEAEVTGTDSPFSVTLTGLEAGKQYVYYAFIKLNNSDDIIKGAEKNFHASSPTLTVNPETLNFNASGNSAQSVTVTCNTDSWTVTADSWITITDKTATGFKVSVNDNTTYETRTGEIIISIDNTSVSKTIAVTVAPTVNPLLERFLGTYTVTCNTRLNAGDAEIPLTYTDYMVVNPIWGGNTICFTNVFNKGAIMDFELMEGSNTDLELVSYFYDYWDDGTQGAFVAGIVVGTYIYFKYDYTLQLDGNNQIKFPLTFVHDGTDGDGQPYQAVWCIIEFTNGQPSARASEYMYDVVLTRTGDLPANIPAVQNRLVGAGKKQSNAVPFYMVEARGTSAMR